MVLWEIALATAYFLGLKRTFKLALKTQRRLIAPTHPRIRQFLRGPWSIGFADPDLRKETLQYWLPQKVTKFP